MWVYMCKKRTLLQIGGALLLAAAALTFSAREAAVPAVSYGKDRPIYSVETAENKLCVTFDAAWDEEDTDALLAILKKYNATATVFAVAQWAQSHPDAVVKFKNAGHTVQIHSFDHTLYTEMSRGELLDDLAACSETLASLTGVPPTLVRVPSGEYTPRVIRTIYTVGLYPIQWDVDSLDYTGLSVREITDRVTSQARNGSIILFHTGVKNTPAALDRILAHFTQKGFRFVPVEELILKDRYYTDETGRHFPAAPQKYCLRDKTR